MDTDHIQLIWDSGCAGTAQTGSGSCLSVGLGGKWTPEQLLLIAAESSIMTIFLRLAGEERLDLLGYVSSAGTIDERLERGIKVVVRPCITVAREEELLRAKELLVKAAQQSRVAQALSGALLVDPEVVLVSTFSAGSPPFGPGPP